MQLISQSTCNRCICYTLCPIWFLPTFLCNVFCITRCICGNCVYPIQQKDSYGESQCCCCYPYDFYS